MMKIVGGLLVATLAVAASGASADDPVVLKVGDRAPAFTLTGTDGKKYTLKDFAGKSAVVLAWYPKAGTGG